MKEFEKMADQVSGEQATVSWCYLPIREHPRQAYFIFALSIAVLFIGTVWMKSPIMGILGSLMFLAGLADFWMPQRFEISERGVKSKIGLSASELDWKSVKAFTNDRDGVRVLPVEETSKMAIFRGVWLRSGHSKSSSFTKDDLVQMIEMHRRKNAE